MALVERLDTTSSHSTVQVEVTAHTRKEWQDRVLELSKVELIIGNVLLGILGIFPAFLILTDVPLSHSSSLSLSPPLPCPLFYLGVPLFFRKFLELRIIAQVPLFGKDVRGSLSSLLVATTIFCITVEKNTKSERPEQCRESSFNKNSCSSFIQ